MTEQGVATAGAETGIGGFDASGLAAYVTVVAVVLFSMLRWPDRHPISQPERTLP